MRRVRDLFILAAAASLAASAMGEEVGIGVSFDSNTIFVPIAITTSLRVEPFGVFYRDSRDNDSSTTGSSDRSSSDSVSMLGIGVFATGSALENVKLYGGGRVGYVREKNNYSYSYSSSDSSSDAERTSGYLLAPTVGFEYFLQKNISLGAEVAVSYTRRTGHESNSSPSREAEITKSSTATSTAVTVRYYWK